VPIGHLRDVEVQAAVEQLGANFFDGEGRA
jgi:hypothetical protein